MVTPALPLKQQKDKFSCPKRPAGISRLSLRLVFPHKFPARRIHARDPLPVSEGKGVFLRNQEKDTVSFLGEEGLRDVQDGVLNLRGP